MRWSIIRLIWLRELRDQLRDRRTLFMIAGLPLILYPVLGVCVLTFALQFFQRPSMIGILRSDGAEVFPGGETTKPQAIGSRIGHFASASDAWPAALMRSRIADVHLEYPVFIRGDGMAWSNHPLQELFGVNKFKFVWFEGDGGGKKALADRDVDLLLTASVGFNDALEDEEMGVVDGARPPRADGRKRPTVTAHLRPDDDHGRQALSRLRPYLDQWKREQKKVRFVRRGLDASFDEPFDIAEPRSTEISDPRKLGELMIRVFPFLLVMWTLAGALYPAVDLCAGEKERGTMETLLITPAGREEIVLGKFLTIWMFSAGSALLNLLSMGITTWQFSSILPAGSFPRGALLWCVLLSLPLSALFSAISLAIGAYARSSKEGQYYLMPMFLFTMPLIFLTLAPGVELNPVYSLVPVTGVALLMQKLMISPSLGQVPWLYFIPVLVPIAIYSALALRWAIDQFQREEVLFREAERLDIILWLRRLFQEKQTTATAGQAFFCFAMILGLSWVSIGFGKNLSRGVHSAISLLAFVATPALMMTIMLNTKPTRTLMLRWPRLRELGRAVLLAVFVLPTILWASQVMFTDFPHLRKLLDDPRPIIQELRALTEGSDSILSRLLVFAFLPAICEELAFRGVILTGLQKRYRPRTAILLCAFMNALFHMNVFTFLPIFAIAVLLGLLTERSESILPAMLLHFATKVALLLSVPVGAWINASFPEQLLVYWPAMVGCCFGLAVVLFWNLYRKPYWE